MEEKPAPYTRQFSAGSVTDSITGWVKMQTFSGQLFVNQGLSDPK